MPNSNKSTGFQADRERPDCETSGLVKPKGQYRAHRERQRNRILEAAQQIFDTHSIDRASVGEIIEETGIRASTFYEYFTNKDEIVWALVQLRMAESYAAIKQRVGVVEGQPAYARIVALLEAFREELLHRPQHVRFMAQFDAMYGHHWTADRLLQAEAELSPEGFGPLKTMIEQGIADGSLRANLDPDITLHSVLNTVIGTQRRLAALGSRVEQEYGHSIQRLFDEALRVLLMGLRAVRS